MTGALKATAYANITRVAAFLISMSLLLSAALLVKPDAIDADPFGYVTMVVVAAFMLLWSITDVDIVGGEKP